jgi:hypothetical protein
MRSLLVLLLAGCSQYDLVHPQTPPLQAFGAPPATHGQVCVFRPHTLGSALTATFRDNGTLVGATRGPTYFCYLAEPGVHLITVDGGDAPDRTMVIRAGEARYFHHEINMGTDDLRLIDLGTAQRLASACEYTSIAGGPDEVPPAVPIARAQ